MAETLLCGNIYCHTDKVKFVELLFLKLKKSLRYNRSVVEIGVTWYNSKKFKKNSSKKVFKLIKNFRFFSCFKDESKK